MKHGEGGRRKGLQRTCTPAHPDAMPGDLHPPVVDLLTWQPCCPQATDLRLAAHRPDGTSSNSGGIGLRRHTLTAPRIDADPNPTTRAHNPFVDSTRASTNARIHSTPASPAMAAPTTGAPEAPNNARPHALQSPTTPSPQAFPCRR
ncbi:hypothetical protein GCM10027590_14550 [Nocardiopsis nanhaiensis]